MSYKWFKEWADKTPKTVVLIETRDGFESFGTCASVIFRLVGLTPFRPNKKEKTKEPEVLVPRKDYPTLLDRLNRCHISHLVAREDFKVYSKEFDSRFFDLYAAPLSNPEKPEEEERFDRGVSVDDRVTVKNLETRKECCWKLVPEAEADENRREKSGNLSIDSDVGSALIGHRVGEEFTVVRGMNDSASYRILFALDGQGKKLKKIKREERSFAEEEAEDAAQSLDTSESDNAAQSKPVAPHVSSALISDDGPVMVFKEKSPEQLAAEQAESDLPADTEEALLSPEAFSEEDEAPATEPADDTAASDTATDEVIDEESSIADEQPIPDEQPIADEPAETDTAADTVQEAPLSFFERLFGFRKARHLKHGAPEPAKHTKTRAMRKAEKSASPDEQNTAQ